MTIPHPTISLHPLTRADGSATYTHTPTSTTILCGVNFPVEAPARSSLPEECYIEVHVRPSAGVGQVKERHLETLVRDTLRSTVLVEMYPRMMLQVTLQILGQGTGVEAAGVGQGDSYLPVLAGLVNASVAACLDAGVGMRRPVVATLVVVGKDGIVRAQPSLGELKGAKSLHVLAFSSVGKLVLVESEGRFSFEEWEQVEELGRRVCLGHTGEREGDDVDMEEGGVELGVKNLQAVLRSAVETKVVAEERWRGG